MPRDGDVDEGKRATLRRFAALGAATPFVGLASGSDASEEDGSDVREAIRGYLTTTPGAHFSKLRDDLQLGTGEAQHHVRRLADAGAIESRRDGDYRRFFPADRFDDFQQVALGYLRRDTPRGMLIVLLQEPTTASADIAEQVDVSRPTVSKYAAELEEAGLIERDDGYEIQHPETVLTLLVRYADSFGPDAVALADEADSFVRYEP